MQPSVIVWDLETVPDIGGFAAANDLVGKSDVEVREAIGDKFPKHICLAKIWSVGIRAARQAHREHGALARLARHRHVAAHYARELAREGKAEPSSAIAPRGQGIGLREFLE
jgi:hypothetical protein